MSLAECSAVCSQGKAGVSQERERQVLLRSNPTMTSSLVILGFTDGVDTQVRKFGAI
jgi:hypothetical protein